MALGLKLEEIKNIAREALSQADRANDYYHVRRVLKIAENLCRKEDVDSSIVKAALLLHNIVPRKKTDDRIIDYRQQSLQKSREILISLDIDEQTISKILNCIQASFFGQENLDQNEEAKIVHDANKLDTIGAHGIARVFAFGSAFKRPIYDPGKSFLKSRQDMETNGFEYNPYELEPDSISHFGTKLLKIKDRMLTETGKELAEKRHKFMVHFLENFFEEEEQNFNV
jgi:uncharacterized protein